MDVSFRLSVIGSLFASTALVSCQAPHPSSLDSQYHLAVQTASSVTQASVYDGLFPIDLNNAALQWNDSGDKLKVVTWKSQNAFDNFIAPNTTTSANEDFVVWVTAVPQLQQFCQNYVKETPNIDLDALSLRLKQYLGLNHTWQYDVFAELWVKPDDLFRPCVDPEINDQRCEIQFSDSPVVSNIASYPAFYQHLYYKSFRQPAGVPWTGVGYTYDWGSETGIGASEYILVPKAAYRIAATYSTAEYCGLAEH